MTMIDVSAKPEIFREATAAGTIDWFLPAPKATRPRSPGPIDFAVPRSKSKLR